jgi:hypothetical protein
VCALGELAESFGEFAEETGVGPGGNGPGCGDQAGLLDWCIPWTFTHNTNLVCTQWGPWVLGGVGGSATCERIRHCTQHFIKVKVHLDCSTTTTPGAHPPRPQVQTMAALPGPTCP